MKQFNKITIIGVGLLGGSIGMAIKRKKLAKEVVGFFRHKNKVAHAVKIGAIDHGTNNFKESIEKSDLIILCSPVKDIIDKLNLIKKIGLKNTLITDIGSTKNEIVQAARGLNFIGAHPLAGSEQSGISSANADLFLNASCILTPDLTRNTASLKRISEFWAALGTKLVILKPEEHDSILAFTSHMPHAIAFSLINAIPEKCLRFSAGGLKDTTRIALSNPCIWSDIFISNKQSTLSAITTLEKSIADLKKSIKNNDRSKLISLLINAGKKRKKLI